MIGSMPLDREGQLLRPQVTSDACCSPVEPSAPQNHHSITSPSDTLATWDIQCLSVGNWFMIHLQLAQPLMTVNWSQISTLQQQI